MRTNMNFSKSVVIVFISVMSAPMNTINGTDPTRNENFTQDRTRLSSSSTPKRSYKGALSSDDSPKELSQDGNEPLDSDLREAIDKATEKFLAEQLHRIIDGPTASSSPHLSPELEETSPKTTPTKPPEEERYQTGSGDDNDEDDTDSRFKATMDDALEGLRAANILERSSSSHSPASTEDENPTVKSAEEDYDQSESDDASHSSLDPLLEAAMKDAVKEQYRKNILETPSSSSEDARSSDLATVPSSSTNRRTDILSFEPPFYQMDAFPMLQPSKAKRQAPVQSHATSSKSTQTEQMKETPAENESESVAPKKMSYALALLSTPKEEDVEVERTTHDETWSRTFPTLADARARQENRRNHASEEDTIELFCPQQKEEVAIQTQGTSLRLKYSANKRQVLVSPKSRHHNVFYEFRRMNIDPRHFGLQTSICLPSGSVLLKFKTEQGTQQLRQAALASGLFEVNSTRSSSCQVRIHGVSAKTTKAELIYDIFRKYKTIPQKVRFTKDERATSRYLSLAIIEVSEPLLEQIMASPEIKVRWQPQKIETTIRLFRCSSCYLMGHRSKQCRMPPRNPPDDEEECVDCAYSNRCSELVGRPKDRAKDTHHSIDDFDLCEVKQNLVSKLMEKFGREVELEPLLM